MAKEAEAAAAPKKSKKLLIIIGLVGRSIRNHAVSTRDMGSLRGLRGALPVAIFFSLSRSE